MKESLTGMVSQHEKHTTPEEMQKLSHLQPALALVTYIQAHDLGMDHSIILKRHDTVAGDIKKNAMAEWSHGDDDLFRAYYLSGPAQKGEALSIDPSDKEACIKFLEKLKDFKRQLSQPS